MIGLCNFCWKSGTKIKIFGPTATTICSKCFLKEAERRMNDISIPSEQRTEMYNVLQLAKIEDISRDTVEG